MSPAIATICYAILIAGLFWLDRNQKNRTAWTLWLPMIWFSIACSRSITQWWQMEGVASADQVLEGSPIDRLAYTCLLAAGVVVLIGRRKRVGQILRANGPILLFFFYSLVTLLWSDYPGVAFKRWTKAIGDLVMLLIIFSDREPIAAIRQLLARLTYVLIPLSVLFIKYYPTLGRGYGEWLGEVQYHGVTTNKNTLGTICLFLGLAALWRLLAAYGAQDVTGRRRRMIAQVIILVMVLWMLRIANSMTSLSCFLMGSTLLLVTNFRMVTRRPVIVHVLIAAMLVVSVSVLFLGASPDALKSMGRNPTLTDRTAVWSMVLGMVQNRWVGTGFESFWLGPRLEKMWARYWWHPGEAHNGYLEIYLNLGWVGVALLFVVLVTGYRTVFRAWRSHVATGSLVLAYFFVGLVYNFTEAAFFRMLHPAWLFFLFAVVSVPLSTRKDRLSTQNLFPPSSRMNGDRATATVAPAVAGAFSDGDPIQRVLGGASILDATPATVPLWFLAS